MRLSLDPIENEHHPRLFYLFTSDLIPAVQSFALRYLGFEERHSGQMVYYIKRGDDLR